MLGNLYTGLYLLSPSDSRERADKALEGSSSSVMGSGGGRLRGGRGGARGFRRTLKWQSVSFGQARCTSRGRSSGCSFRSYSWEGETWNKLGTCYCLELYEN